MAGPRDRRAEPGKVMPIGSAIWSNGSGVPGPSRLVSVATDSTMCVRRSA